MAPGFRPDLEPVTLIGSMFGDRELPAVVAIDEAALSAQLATITDALGIAPVEPVLEITDGTPTLTPGIPGRTLDATATADAMAAALLKPRSPDRGARRVGGSDRDEEAARRPRSLPKRPSRAPSRSRPRRSPP